MGIRPFLAIHPCPSRRRGGRVLARAAVAALVLLAFPGFPADAAAQAVGEYPLKAGYLYNFLLLAGWPARPGEPASAPLVLGIVGDDPFGAAIDPIAGRGVDGRAIAIRRFAAAAAPDELAACHLLFLAPAAAPREQEILARLAGRPVLTVSDAAGFADRGGMIGFVIRGQRLRFEVNRGAAAAAGIELRSKLLRLADRVVGE